MRLRPATALLFPVPRFSRANALWVRRLSCQTWPLPGATVGVAASGDAMNKIALEDAAMARGKTGACVSATGPIWIWSTSAIALRSTIEMFSAPELATTIVDESTIAIERGRLPTRIGDRNVWLVNE